MIYQGLGAASATQRAKEARGEKAREWCCKVALAKPELRRQDFKNKYHYQTQRDNVGAVFSAQLASPRIFNFRHTAVGQRYKRKASSSGGPARTPQPSQHRVPPARQSAISPSK